MEKYIDCHVHPTEARLWIDASANLAPAIGKSEKVRNRFIKPLEVMADDYRSQNTMGILLASMESGRRDPKSLISARSGSASIIKQAKSYYT